MLQMSLDRRLGYSEGPGEVSHGASAQERLRDPGFGRRERVEIRRGLHALWNVRRVPRHEERGDGGGGREVAAACAGRKREDVDRQTFARDRRGRDRESAKLRRGFRPIVVSLELYRYIARSIGSKTLNYRHCLPCCAILS